MTGMKTQDETVIELAAGELVYQQAAPQESNRPQSDSAVEDNEEQAIGTSHFNGAIRGRLVGLSESGAPLVHFSKMPDGSAIPATSVLPLTLQDIGRETILLFEQGDPLKPILMGLVQQPVASPGDATPVEVRLDGEQLVLTGKQEIVLRCGKASITLTRAGKVLIRGAYLLSRSSGANRIKGGSVQIN